ncbi:MAG TPA: anti-sigma regulatory factor [Candidatus Sericytochromatia bacterium]
MQHEKPLKESRLQVETDLNAVPKVLQWFEEFNNLLLPQKVYGECQLALIEGFTNAVRHAHQGLPQTTPIELELQLFPQYLEMRIWDKGQPFDWEAMFEALRQEDTNPLEKEGGRGLIFMKQLTDELSYARLPDDRNCLLMCKRR